jgi:hypothetical protein
MAEESAFYNEVIVFILYNYIIKISIIITVILLGNRLFINIII